jgi:hypothetical protein
VDEIEEWDWLLRLLVVRLSDSIRYATDPVSFVRPCVRLERIREIGGRWIRGRAKRFRARACQTSLKTDRGSSLKHPGQTHHRLRQGVLPEGERFGGGRERRPLRARGPGVQRLPGQALRLGVGAPDEAHIAAAAGARGIVAEAGAAGGAAFRGRRGGDHDSR